MAPNASMPGMGKETNLLCEHCGCRGVPAIGQLMGEHDVLLDQSNDVSQALDRGDLVAAAVALRQMVPFLQQHVNREEVGLFAALLEQGDFADEVTSLAGEHDDLDAAIEGANVHGADFEQRVRRLLADLAEHIERENLGIFPISVVTLGAEGWELVERARPAPV